MSDAKNVSYGKPKSAGPIYRAPLGTALPTSVAATLAAAFKPLGYVSEDGVTNTNTADTDHIKAWGGDPVLYLQNEKEDLWAFTLIESGNEETLKAVYGDENVTGTAASGIAITANAKQQPNCCWVFDMIMADGRAKRIVLPNAGVTEVGEIVYKDDEAIGYEVTLGAVPDTNGNTHYEYISGASTYVTLNKSAETVAEGSTVALTATTSPASGTVKWSSSDTDVATVTGGTVTGVDAGEAVITATVVETGATASCVVTVTE